MVNPRWMRPVCCIERLQPRQAPSTGSGSRRGSGVVRVLSVLCGMWFEESMWFSVPMSEASACHSGCPWFTPASSWLASKYQAGGWEWGLKSILSFFFFPESRMLNCVNEEQVSKWVCGKYAPIYLFQLSLLIYSSWQHLFILVQESL